MVDRDDDLRAGAKSTAILFGDMDLVAQGVLYAAVLRRAGAGRPAGRAGPDVLERARRRRVCWWRTNSSIARHRDRDACFRAFLHNHWVGAAVFAGIAVAYWQASH